MSARNRPSDFTEPAPKIGAGHVATLVVALAVLAVAFWMRDGGRVSGDAPDRHRGRERIAPSASRLAPETSAAFEPALAGFAAHPGAPLESPPGRSPLERSPGYVPPADPESASVRLGRREAPLLDGEFDGGTASLEEFCRFVVTALNAGDEGALHALRVTRAEFERFLWREFPQSRPITNITADDAWGLSDAGSLAGASRAVGQHGGRRLRFLRVEHGPTQDFTNFDLVRGLEIVAESEITKEIHAIRFVPSVAVRNGRYKALLYRD